MESAEGTLVMEAAERVVGLEVRAGDLAAARKVLGEALGRCRRLAKPKLYAGYAHLERQLGEVDRCRTIYGKWVEADPGSSAAWAAFGDLEHAVGEQDRARAVYELALKQPELDKPEAVWKKYVDLEIFLEHNPDEDDGDGAAGGPPRAATLYERLLERTGHVKVYLSYAAYEEAAPAGPGRGAARRAAAAPPPPPPPPGRRGPPAGGAPAPAPARAARARARACAARARSSAPSRSASR